MNATEPTLRELLDRYPVTMTASYVDRETDSDGWDHDAWECTLYYEDDAREQRSMTVQFRMGTGHRGAAPELADVMDSLLSDACTVDNAQGFEDWCSELGFDPDSRKAERIYNACVEQTEQLKALLGEHYETFLYAERN